MESLFLGEFSWKIFEILDIYAVFSRKIWWGAFKNLEKLENL